MCCAKTSQWADAKKAFAAGSSALSQFPPLWKQRFARAAAETALALGDVGGARSWINFALENLADPDGGRPDPAGRRQGRASVQGDGARAWPVTRR